jgi:hypothetical protein
LPPELAHIPPEVIAALTSRAARQRSRSGARGRLSPAGLGLAIVVALALILGSNGSTQPSSSSTGIDQGLGHEETVNGLELTPMPSVEIAGFQSIDQPTYEFPPGPSVVRIEVVSDDPAADIVVTSDIGDAEVPGEALPFAAELNLGERAEQLAVTALARYGDGTIQCRVYADGQLVAINTGDGLVECVAEPAR